VAQGITDNPALSDGSSLADHCNESNELFPVFRIISLTSDYRQQSDQLSHCGEELLSLGTNQSLALDVLIVLV